MKGALSLTEQLAKHLQRPVDEATRQRARLHLLDWLACVAGARQSDLARRIIANVETIEYAIDKAAWLGNVLEMDDVHRTALLHPGPVVWPSSLAFMCESEDGQLEDVLCSAVKGYEAMIAIGSTFDDAHYSSFHNTATAGVFGSVAARWPYDDSMPEDFPQEIEQQSSAFGLAGSVSSGLWQMRHEVSDGKQWHIVHALNTASNACCFAWDGVIGPRFILEGPQGLYAATCREPKPMTFPDQWRIHEVSFKPWAACRHAHPAIDCALELRAAGKLTAPYHVETYADAITFCDKPDPKTEIEAKFSLQHAVAVIADGRRATPADFTPEAIAALAPLRAQVTVAEAPEITARYPAHFGARVNGLELVDCLGDPERPVGEAEIIAKMHMLAEWGGLPADEADRAVELTLRGNDAGAIVTMLGDWLA
jgi:2-methylcitrate dehydratase PrpD